MLDSRAKRVEPDAFARMNHCKLARHGKNGALFIMSGKELERSKAGLPWMQCLEEVAVELGFEANTWGDSQASCGVAAPIMLTNDAVLIMLPPVWSFLLSSVYGGRELIEFQGREC